MAKRGAKSAAIREYIEQKPEAKAREVIDALAKQKIKVSANQVYALLNKLNGEAAPKAPEAQTSPHAPPVPPSNVESLFHAKTLVIAVGGIDAARRTLDTYEKLLA